MKSWGMGGFYINVTQFILLKYMFFHPKGVTTQSLLSISVIPIEKLLRFGPIGKACHQKLVPLGLRCNYVIETACTIQFALRLGHRNSMRHLAALWLGNWSTVRHSVEHCGKVIRTLCKNRCTLKQVRFHEFPVCQKNLHAQDGSSDRISPNTVNW